MKVFPYNIIPNLKLKIIILKVTKNTIFQGPQVHFFLFTFIFHRNSIFRASEFIIRCLFILIFVPIQA